MGDGGIIWKFRVWLALTLMPTRLLRLFRRALHSLPDDGTAQLYWSDDRLPIDDISDTIRRRREIESALPRVKEAHDE